MGRRTKSPSAASGKLEDISAGEVVQDCPLQRKGALRFVVTHADTGKPVKGVEITLSGSASGKGKTDRKGRLEFKQLDQGACSYDADYRPSKLKMLVEDTKAGNTSVKGGKRRIIPLALAQNGELIVEVCKDDKGKPGAALADTDVISISAGGVTVRDKAKTDATLGRPGRVTVTAAVRGPVWVLPDQDMNAEIVAGKTTTFKIRAAEMTWVKVQLWNAKGGDAGTGAWLTGGTVQISAGDETPLLRTNDANDPNHAVKKPLSNFKVTEAASPDKANEEDLFLFEDLS